jgi:hypothetical protein
MARVSLGHILILTLRVKLLAKHAITPDSGHSQVRVVVIENMHTLSLRIQLLTNGKLKKFNFNTNVDCIIFFI